MRTLPTAEAVLGQMYDVLATMAPDTDAHALARDRPLREQVDLDSFDFVNVVMALQERLGVDIPEADHGKLGTLDDIVAYFTEPRPAGSAAT